MNNVIMKRTIVHTPISSMWMLINVLRKLRAYSYSGDLTGYSLSQTTDRIKRKIKLRKKRHGKVHF